MRQDPGQETGDHSYQQSQDDQKGFDAATADPRQPPRSLGIHQDQHQPRQPPISHPNGLTRTWGPARPTAISSAQGLELRPGQLAPQLRALPRIKLERTVQRRRAVSEHGLAVRDQDILGP